jgi:hypothetical protein
MKLDTAFKNIVGLMVLCSVSLSGIHAQIPVVEDTFSGSAGSFNGHTPELSPDGNSWMMLGSAASLDLTGEGQLTQNTSNANGFAFLDLGTAINGQVPIQIEIDIFRAVRPSYQNGWFGFGFTNTTDVATSSGPPFGNSEGGPWLRFQENGAGWIYGGAATNNQIQMNTHFGSSSVTVAGETTKIVFDFDPVTNAFSVSNGFAATAFEGTLAPTHTPTYRYLFLRWFSDSLNPTAFQIENLSLAVIPEPRVYALMAGIAALGIIALRSRRFGLGR